MGQPFRFRGYTRRAARSMVEVMMPRWPEFEEDITDDVLESVEATLDGYPPLVRTAMVGILYALELGAPVLTGGVRPLSWRPFLDRERRLEALNDSPVASVRRLVFAYKVLISLGAYSHPAVEAFLGVPRRAWREERRRFREKLVAIDEARELPPVPEPLGADVDVERYLEPGVLDGAEEASHG